MPDLDQVLAMSKNMLLISLVISAVFAAICGVIASRRKLRVVFWVVMGFAFGPFALPFVFGAKPVSKRQPDEKGPE
jgi:predicted Kef-type K+ transport protein